MFKRLLNLSLIVVAIAALLPLTQAKAQGIDWKSELKNWSGKTLKIIMIQDPWVTAFDAIDKEFEALTGAKVVIDSYSYDATHEKEVLVGTSKSKDYDVVVLDAPWVGEFAEGKFVEDLKPYIDKTKKEIVAWDDFVPSFQAVSDWKGKIVGIPFGAYFVMLHYRTDIFEKAGLKPPKTIEEWKKDAELLTKSKDFPNVYGVAMNNQRGSAVGQAWFEYIYNMGGKPFESMYPGSKDPYADMTPLMDSKEGIATTQLFIDMLKFQPTGAESFAWDERTATFATGQTAMLSEWSVRTPGLANPKQSSVVGKFATTTFPAKEGVTPVPPLGGWVMGINTVSEQKDMAWDYIKWFTSQEIHKKFVLAGGPPSRLSTMQDADVVKAQSWVPVIFETQKTTFADCRPRIPESSQIIDVVGQYVSKAMQGSMTAEEAMKAASKDIGKLLKDAGYNVKTQ
ncbi:MAG: sugar ABC transporter substrate-binding protein [Anaerolineae bacterium]|nr:sugar ABC transporter substrate-binding protein [Anaerolineae bacterium]